VTDTDLLAEADDAAAPPGEADDQYGYQPVNWRDLTPAEEAYALAELTTWLVWAQERYDVPGNILPPCWKDHPWLVEELSALHVAWLVCFDPQDSGLGPLQWLERFHQTKERIKPRSRCTETSHQTAPRRTPIT